MAVGDEPSTAARLPTRIVFAATAADARRLVAELSRPGSNAPGHGAGLGRSFIPDWVILLSPAAASSSMSWREVVSHELAHHALGQLPKGLAPEEAPRWVFEGVAATVDGRFQSPLGRSWTLPPREEVEAFFDAAQDMGGFSLAPSLALAPDPAPQVVLSYLTLRGLLRAQGPGGLRALLAQGGRARSPKTLPSLLRREWQRERREKSFTGAKPAARPSIEAQKLERLARLLAHDGHYAAAAKELRRAYKRSGAVDIGLRLLPLDVQNGDWESAGKLCRDLPRRLADGFSYRFLCGQLYIARQEYPRAIEALQGAVDIEPYNVDAHRAPRDVYARTKRSREKLDAQVILNILKAPPEAGQAKEAP